MRLHRLDLTRYGRFTDCTLDFGEPQPGAPDLTLIIGANEAGKSTAFDALLSLLFGIPTQTDYAFLHDYKTMEVGGRISVGGRVLDLKRIKTTQNSLRTPAGDILPPGALGATLGGLTRETYRAMFSLDDRSLKDGGEAILASKGELGAMLFAASSGLSEIAGALDDVRKQADGLHKPRAQTTRLREATKRLEDVRRRLAETDVNASQFETLRQAVENARSAFEAADAEQSELIRRQAEIARLRGALPLGARYRRDMAALAPIAHRPPPPEGWAARAGALVMREADIAAQERACRDAVAVCERKLERLVLDTDALGLADALASLADGRAKYHAATLDLPRRHGQQRDAAQEVARQVMTLGLDGGTNPESLLLPVSVVARLEELADRFFTVSAAAATASEEATAARMHVEALGASLAVRLPPDDGVLDGLMTRIAGEDHTGQRTRLCEDIARNRARLNGILLAPFAGTTADLVAMAAPSADTARGWGRALAEAQMIASTAARRAAETAEKAALAAAQAGIRAETEGLADDGRLAGLALAREAAWNAHALALDGPERRASADSYAAAARAEREALTGNLARAGRLGEWRAEVRAAETLRAEAGLAEAASKAAADALAAVRRQIDQALRVCGLPDGMAPDDFALWLDRRGDALDLENTLAQQQAQRAVLDGYLAASDSALRQALAAHGLRDMPGASLSSLLDAGRTALRDAAAARAWAVAADRALEDARRQLASRHEVNDTAGKALAQWNAEWRAALAATWIDAGRQGVAPSVAEVRAILTTLASLREAIGARDRFIHQVETMQADQAALIAALEALANRAGVALDADNPMAAAALLDERLSQAQDMARQRTECLSDLEKARRSLADAEVEKAKLLAERDAMLAFYGVGTTEALRTAIAEGERADDLRNAVDAAAQELPLQLHMPDVALALGALDACDADALDAEAASLATRLAQTRTAVQGLHADWRDAKKAFDAVGADARGALLAEERRTILLEIEDIATRYLTLKIGVMAVDAALKTYRDNHRSGMLADAAARFRRITGGGFSDLRTHSTDKGETLVGVRAEGGSLMADAMSKGTRDQLFFALRMAGYREFVQTREPLPFVGDDIMETFDDTRAAATFEMLADIARHGQVIYFTHHDHLAPIAQRVVGAGLRVVRLDGTGSLLPP